MTIVAALSSGPLSGADARAAAKKKLQGLTLEEKVSLLTAADFWRTVGIPEKGIPAAKTTDGPNGARGAIFVGGTKAALFPCGISLASTWNKELLNAVGEHIALEAKARSANILLAPTVCLHRHPLGGRNFESFSEDPFLTGKLAVQYIRGVQKHGVAATIKHFVANEQETNRMTADSQVPERALRELYLRPFEMAVREAQPWAFMSSYNLVNGVHASMNNHTLKDILRGEWGYEGAVMSDWTGTNSTVEGIQAGCDVEFPHSEKWRLAKAVQAVKEGRLSEADVDKAAENVLTLVLRTKGNDLAPEAAEREDDRAETRQLIRELGAQGLTLLKNEQSILPIDPKTTKVAVIGPNANRAIAGGGGSASLNPYYNTLPLDSIRKAVAAATGNSESDETLVPYAVGCQIHKWLPLATPFCTTSDGKPGLKLEWYKGDKFEGDIVKTELRSSSNLFLFDSVPTDKVGEVWSVVATAQVTPQTTGRHAFGFSTVGPGQLYVDGKLAVDLWNWEKNGHTLFGGSEECLVTVDLEAGKPVQVQLKTTNEVRPETRKRVVGLTHEYGGCRLGYAEQDDTDYLQQAVEVAKAADVAVVVVGVDGEWESEGYDRDTMDLPRNGSQDRLIEAVVAVNPRTVVVNQSGSPVTMPWLERVPAVLQAWYQGQEAGNALADVLFGAKNPSGKLPCTFPKRLEDTAAFHNWPGENLEARYGEGIYIGYRHFERCKIEPLFPFGFGLSYTTYAYGPAKMSGAELTADGTLTVTLAISNTGSVAGGETVQAYVRDEESRLPRPEKELAAFDKVFLQPGETKDVQLTLDKFSVGYYDTSISQWIAEAGKFEVLVGASSADIRQTLSFEVKKSFTWVF